jgi:hypothetical protein
MINEFKKELIDYGTAQLPKYAPKDLDLYKENDISLLLDRYTDKWVALHNVLRAKRKEILKRQQISSIECMDLQNEFELAVSTVRNKFTTAYPLNL